MRGRGVGTPASLVALLALQLGACGGGHPGFPPLQPCDPDVLVPSDRVDSPDAPPAVTDAPRLQNGDRVRRYIDQVYPPELRQLLIGGRVDVHVAVATDGTVADARVGGSSGEEKLDAAALRVARIMEFRPALNGGCAVPMWISLPVNFRVRS